MSPQSNERGKIRITLDDLNRVAAAQEAADAPGAGRIYGNIQGGDVQSTLASTPETEGNIFLRAWCYLGLAGLTGAILAWGICEPRFMDGGPATWANIIIFPLMLVLMCTSFGISESLVERSPKKAVIRGALSLGVGTVLGFVFSFIANIIFAIGVGILQSASALSIHNPGLWITRAIAWMGFGVAGGVVYGIVGQSGKRCLYGVAGGVAGAGLGGLLFDPIALATGGGAASRAIGMALFGAATGIAIGLVESALKDRWLYVSAGPLAGKQFILYKPVTIIGSNQSCDIYLFKDPAIMARHAAIELRGSGALLRAAGLVSIDGRTVREAYLESGSIVQIGKYGFLYKDRERTAR